MASYVNVLPAEMWVQVMEYVPPKDLCSVLLTSQHMNSLASTQQLWAGTKINKEKVKQDGLTQLFRINRFEKIKAIDLSSAWEDWGDWVTDEERMHNLLKEIPQTPLEQVDLSRNNMDGVPAEALAQGVAHLKAVDLTRTSLTTIQSSKVLEASISANSLQKVNLRQVDLSRVPASLLARAVSRLQTVKLSHTSLTAQQSTVMLEASLSSNSLQKVNLCGVDLRGVPASLLARSVSRLQTVDLWHTLLTFEQSAAILEGSLSSSSLVEIKLCWVDLSRVPASLLAGAVSRLQTVDLTYTRLTAQQSAAILEAILSSATLIEVNLTGVNLRTIPSQVLAKAVGRLQSVNLAGTHLTAQQYAAIVEAILSSITLVEVNLTWANLSTVPSEVLAKAVGRLQSVSLHDTIMTRNQWIAVGQAVVSSTSLRHADLRIRVGIRQHLPAQLINFLKLKDYVKI